MQAIFTKHLPATATLPDRIRTSIRGFSRITEVSSDADFEVHLSLMRATALLFNMTGEVAVANQPGGCVFVFLDGRTFSVPERVIEFAPAGTDANGEPMFDKVYRDSEGNVTENLGPWTPEDDLI